MPVRLFLWLFAGKSACLYLPETIPGQLFNVHLQIPSVHLINLSADLIYWV
jgi:hypothetical protein